MNKEDLRKLAHLHVDAIFDEEHTQYEIESNLDSISLILKINKKGVK